MGLQDSVSIKYQAEKKEAVTEIRFPENEQAQVRQDRWKMYGINFLLLILAIAIAFIFFKKRTKNN